MGCLPGISVNTPKLNSWFARPSSNLFSFSPPSLHPVTQVRIRLSPSPLHLGYHQILLFLPAIDETPAGLHWGRKKALGCREEIAPIWPASSHLQCHPQKVLRLSCFVCYDSHPPVQRSPSSQLLFDKVNLLSRLSNGLGVTSHKLFSTVLKSLHMGLSNPHKPISCSSAPPSWHLRSSTCQDFSSLRTFTNATPSGKDLSIHQHHLPGGAFWDHSS